MVAWKCKRIDFSKPLHYKIRDLVFLCVNQKRSNLAKQKRAVVCSLTKTNRLDKVSEPDKG